MKAYDSCSIVRPTIVFMILVLGLHSTFALSQESAVLTPDALVTEVIDSNAGLSSRELMVKAQRALVDSAGALDDPRISYSVAPATAGEPIPSSFGNALGVRQVVQFSQTFPWPGKRDLRTDLAQTRAEIEQYSYEELLLALVSQSRSLWARLWYLEQALSTNAQHRKLLEDLEEVTTTQYASGLGLQQDVLQIQASLIEVNHRESVLNQERRRARARINDLLNQPAANNPGVPAAELPEPDVPAPHVIRDWMLAQQPELQALEAESEAAYTRLQLEKKSDFPDIQLNLGYNELWNDSSLRFQVGVSVNIPLDLGNKRSARKAAAGFEYSSSQADLQRMKRKLSAELEQQLSYYDELTHNINLYETELILKAEETFNAASANYEGGGGNFATLVEVQQQLLNLRLHLEQMRSEKVTALSEIDRLSGGMVWPVEEIR